jgi:hypothetical protein
MTLKHPSTFTVRGLPRPLFGETYAIISVWKADDTTWKAEYDVLTKVPHEHLIRDVIQFDATDYPDDLPPFDEAAMETEAIQQAETALTLELERRAIDAKREDLAYEPVYLERANISLFMLWKRNAFPTKFGDMARDTKSDA